MAKNISVSTYVNVCITLSSKLSDFREIIGNNDRVWLIFSNYTKVEKKVEPKNFEKTFTKFRFYISFMSMNVHQCQFRPIAINHDHLGLGVRIETDQL